MHKVAASLLSLSILAGPSTPSSATVKDTSKVVTDTESESLCVVHAELQTGDTFTDFGVGAAVPPPGRWVLATDSRQDSPGQQVSIQTDLFGVVTVCDEGLEEFIDDGVNEQGLEPLPECLDPAGNLHGHWWTQTFQWWFRVASTPTEVNEDNARDALRDATSNITHVNNDCDHGDNVSATAGFQGDTTRSGDWIQFEGTYTCDLYPDGFSVTGFGTLNFPEVGATCVWGNGLLWPSGGIADESDMRMNKHDQYGVEWVANINQQTCENKMSIRSIATHERGHTFGIDDVDDTYHPHLTMRDTAGELAECTEEMASLGLGDWQGLESRY